ncbi:MAG TPA: T9SS type A sorting domain-containing protein [Chitinophagales bacterium]|nr:T9SS type A sorting domain-containing protein [Chitinophagales bacterium]
MKKYILLMCFALTQLLNYAQAPLKKMWDNAFGSPQHDRVVSIKKTLDGGYILAGESRGPAGADKSQPNWDIAYNSRDYWVVKINAWGVKEWDRRFGGILDDHLYCIEQCADGGYLLGGNSQSDISGDKTQDKWSQGWWDYWVVKIDAQGNKQWDRRYGGSLDDNMVDLKQTADGGYILAGYSESDSSGDKSKNQYGGGDYWIVKIDEQGTKQWDKQYGSAGIHGHELLYTIKITADKGFLLVGSSTSGISVDKTDTCRGLRDFWIVKTDSAGNKQWDKTFGGALNDEPVDGIQLVDGGYLFAGISGSDAGGDKTAPNVDIGPLEHWDWWVVRTDAQGNKLWDKKYGGTSWEDWFGNIVQVEPGKFLLTGSSYSDISGDKTEMNRGESQAWMVMIDDTGGVIWDKTILTDGYIYQRQTGLAVLAESSCYTVALNTYSGIAGDKTAPSRGECDMWVVKFCDTTVACNSSVSVSVSGNYLTAYNGAAYQWYLNGEVIAGANSASYWAMQPGLYTVEIIYSNGCSAISLPIDVTATTVTEITNSMVELWPNPAENRLFINANVPIAEINIYTVTGMIVYSGGPVLQGIDVSGFSSGVYIADINTGNVHLKKKWLKQ